MATNVMGMLPIDVTSATYRCGYRCGLLIKPAIIMQEPGCKAA